MTTLSNPEDPVDERVFAVVRRYPEAAAEMFMDVRRIAIDVANETDAGPLTEDLKWGQPSWLTEESKAGTTLRFDWSDSDPDHARLLVHCQTNIVEVARERFADVLSFEGNRAVVLPMDAPLDEDVLTSFVAMALTYHRDKSS